jgi:hypothetical protein
VGDLLLCAKHLFVAAMVAGCAQHPLAAALAVFPARSPQRMGGRF